MIKLIELRRIVREVIAERRDDAKENDLTKYYPPDHELGMRVPKGGSSCSKCQFVSEDGTRCANKGFQAWQADKGKKDPSNLPAPADEYCCDNFKTK